MDLQENNFNRYEVALWEMMRSLTDIKDCVESSEHIHKKELSSLKDKCMEAGEWIKNRMTE